MLTDDEFMEEWMDGGDEVFGTAFIVLRHSRNNRKMLQKVQQPKLAGSIALSYFVTMYIFPEDKADQFESCSM